VTTIINHAMFQDYFDGDERLPTGLAQPINKYFY